MGIGIIDDVDNIVTVPFKQEGSAVYLVGETLNEMAGSAYLRMQGVSGGTVPRVHPLKLAAAASILVDLAAKKRLRACHDLSEGGLALALAEMCIGSGIGADVSIAGRMRPDVALFSESNTRWVCEVAPEDAAAFEDGFRSMSIAVQRIGTTKGDTLSITYNDRRLATLPCDEMYTAWQEPIWDIMG